MDHLGLTHFYKFDKSAKGEVYKIICNTDTQFKLVNLVKKITVAVSP